jgi:hypothetical protein
MYLHDLQQTVIALWLGWNVYQLQRREMIANWITLNQFGDISMGEPQYPWKRFPITWRLLGAEPVREIIFRGFNDEGDREQLRASFPEAVIRYSQ